jgi:hypothetical protein
MKRSNFSYYVICQLKVAHFVLATCLFIGGIDSATKYCHLATSNTN